MMRRRLFLAISAIAIAVPASLQADTGAYTALENAQVSTYAAFTPFRSNLGRARAEMAAGRYDLAARLLEPMADGAGDRGVVLLAGYANLGAGRTGRAEMYFKRVMKRDSTSAFARHGLGLAAIARGDRAGAVAQLHELNQMLEHCSQSCSRAADLQQSVASLRRAIG